MARKKVTDKGNVVTVNKESNKNNNVEVTLSVELASIAEKTKAVDNAIDALLSIGRVEAAQNVLDAYDAFVANIKAQDAEAKAEKVALKEQAIIDSLPEELRGNTIMTANAAMRKAYELVLCLPQNTPRTKVINGLMLALLKGEHQRMTLVDICNETGLMPSSVRGHFGTSKHALNNNGMTQRGLRFVVADKQPVRLRDASGALHVLGK